MTTRKNWPQRLSFLSLLLIAGSSVVVLLVFISLGQYAYPAADDFCMAVGIRDEGFFSHLWQHYLQWSGRYFGNALYAAYPLLFGFFKGYGLLAGLIICCLYLASVFLLISIFNLSARNISSWLVALLLVCGFILGLRHTASSLYWMASALTYQSANILLLLTLAFIIRVYQRQHQIQNASGSVAILALLLVLGAGTNEIYLIVLTLLMGGLLVAFRWLHGIRQNTWLMLFVLTLICFAVVYLSPGTGVRESTFPLRHDWVRSIRGSLDMGIWSLLVWTGNPVFIASSLLAPFATIWLCHLSDRVLPISNQMLWLLILLTFSSPFVLQFPAWWSMGGWPPPRTVDAIFFIFYLCWFALLGALTMRFLPARWFFNDAATVGGKVSVISFLLSSVFVFSVFGISAKFSQAWGDLRFRSAPFYEYMMQRHTLIETSRLQGNYYVNVPALPEPLPHSIYFNDIQPDWRDWRNVCYASYFGLRGIQRIVKPKADLVNP